MIVAVEINKKTVEPRVCPIYVLHDCAKLICNDMLL